MFENEIFIGLIIAVISGIISLLNLKIEYHSGMFVGKKDFSIDIVSTFNYMYDEQIQATVYAIRFKNTGSEEIKRKDFEGGIQIISYPFDYYMHDPRILEIRLISQQPVKLGYRIGWDTPYANVLNIYPLLLQA